MSSNPYKSAVEHLQFDEAFDEQTIALMIDAAQRKKAIQPFRIPKSSWRYIAAAAVIVLLFIAVPLIKDPQNTNEITTAAAMTEAGYEITTAAAMTEAGYEITTAAAMTEAGYETTTVAAMTAAGYETTALTTQSADVYSPGTVIEDGTMYVSSTTSRLEPRSMNELVNVADNIFTGLCVSSEPVFQNDFLYTLSKVQVTAVFKGAFQVGDIVPVIEMGGRTTIGEYRKETTVEIKDFDHYDDSISADTKFVEGMDGYYPLKVDDNVLLFAGDTSGFLNDFTGPLYDSYGDYEGKMYFKNENVYARNTPSNTDQITFDDKSASISLDELKLLIEDSK